MERRGSPESGAVAGSGASVHVTTAGPPPWREGDPQRPQESGIELEPETLEEPGMRVPRMVLAVAVLLLGLGLSQVVGMFEGDEAVAPSPAEPQAERQVAHGAETGVQERADSDDSPGWCPCEWTRGGPRQQLLSERSRRLAVVEEGLIAFARLADAAASDPASARFLTPAERPLRQVVMSWVRALRSGDQRAVRGIYAPRSSVVFLQAGFPWYQAEGPSKVAATVGNLMTRRLRFTTPIVGQEQFASAEYTDTRSRGIVLVRAVDGRITEQWVIVGD